MAKLWKLLMLLALVCLAAPSRADDDDETPDEEDYADVDRAHLIISKTFKADVGVQGRNLTVEIRVYNAGSSAALAVDVADSALPEGVELVEGQLKAQYKKIDYSSLVTYTYVVVPTTAIGELYLRPATVSYKAEADAQELQVGYSSQAAIYIMTPVEQIQRHALTVGTYVSLGAMQSGKDWRNFAVIIAMLGGLLGANQLVKTFKSATVTRKRKNALAALEKDE